MTVIAWDGHTLAADSLACNNDFGYHVTKIFREGNSIIAFSGGYEAGLSMLEWYRNGEQAANWPAHQAGDEWCRLVVARREGAYCYEKLPIKQHVTEPYMAWGSGRDFALGAFCVGANAVEAAKAAVMHCITCGGSVTFFHLEP